MRWRVDGPDSMTDGPSLHILLIHGSFLGGWCWHAVQDMLSSKGFASSAPTLTGCGDRHHLATPDVGLTAHVADVVEHLKFVDAERLVVVGHSYGALVASEIADHERDRVSDLIILDGFIGVAGQSLYESNPDIAPILKAQVREHQPGYLQPPPAAFLGMPDTPAATATEERMRAMAEAANTDRARVSANALKCRRRYIRFAGFPGFAATAAAARGAGWQVSELAVGHMALITDPERVATAIIGGTGT